MWGEIVAHSFLCAKLVWSWVFFVWIYGVLIWIFIQENRKLFSGSLTNYYDNQPCWTCWSIKRSEGKAFRISPRFWLNLSKKMMYQLFIGVIVGGCGTCGLSVGTDSGVKCPNKRPFLLMISGIDNDTDIINHNILSSRIFLWILSWFCRPCRRFRILCVTNVNAA